MTSLHIHHLNGNIGGRCCHLAHNKNTNYMHIHLQTYAFVVLRIFSTNGKLKSILANQKRSPFPHLISLALQLSSVGKQNTCVLYQTAILLGASRSNVASKNNNAQLPCIVNKMSLGWIVGLRSACGTWAYRGRALREGLSKKMSLSNEILLYIKQSHFSLWISRLGFSSKLQSSNNTNGAKQSSKVYQQITVVRKK